MVLDFTGCRYAGEIHKIIKEAFDFPDYYGENLDALWDCLRDYCPQNTVIYICGLSDLPKEFNEYATKITEIFYRITQETENVSVKVLS